MSLYKFYPNFSVIFRRFVSADPTRKLVEELHSKAPRRTAGRLARLFFEAGCKGSAICLFNQIFLSLSPFCHLRLNPHVVEELTLPEKRTAKIQRVFLLSKFFSKELSVY